MMISSIIRRIVLVALILYGLTLLIACKPTAAAPAEPVVRWKGRMDTLWTAPAESVALWRGRRDTLRVTP